jgi:hypothetical protein
MAKRRLDKILTKKLEENKRMRQKIESEPFIKAGYKVWFVWEDQDDTIRKSDY